MTQREINRYKRHILLPNVGQEGQKKLKKSKILVVGAGGLGSPILLYLTSAGIGKIGMIDFDDVDISNLQRQVLYREESLGQNKVLYAKKTLENLNSDVNIIAYSEKLTQHNALRIFSNYDIIIDGTDNFSSRYLINDACLITNKPFIYGSVFEFTGQLSVFNYRGSGTYRCLYPVQNKNARPASEVGIMGFLPGIIGTQQVNEAIKIILEIGEVMSDKLLIYNSLNSEYNIIAYKKTSFNVMSENEFVNTNYF